MATYYKDEPSTQPSTKPSKTSSRVKSEFKDEPLILSIGASYPISDELADFFGIPRDTKCPVSEMTTGMFAYIDSNNLRHFENSNVYVELDEKLKKLFNKQVDRYTPYIVNLKGKKVISHTVFSKLMLKHCGRMRHFDIL